MALTADQVRYLGAKGLLHVKEVEGGVEFSLTKRLANYMRQSNPDMVVPDELTDIPSNNLGEKNDNS